MVATGFSYDGLGNRLTFVNEKGSVWSYAYDAAGRLVTETTPLVDGHGQRLAPVSPNLVEGATVEAASSPASPTTGSGV